MYFHHDYPMMAESWVVMSCAAAAAEMGWRCEVCSVQLSLSLDDDDVYVDGIQIGVREKVLQRHALVSI